MNTLRSLRLVPLSPNNPMRRFAETGAISRGTPARWAGALLLAGMGAAWAFSPSSTSSTIEASGHATLSTIIEGEAQAVCELSGALWGRDVLSASDQKNLALAGRRRVVLEYKAAPFQDMAARRSRTEFGRIIEDMEARYIASGRYPAIPSSSGKELSLSYQADSEGFTAASGGLCYSASSGLSRVPVDTSSEAVFRLKGFLASREVGWGPWKHDQQSFQPISASQDEKDFDFLETLSEPSPNSARMFFRTDRINCGYLFCHRDGESIYSNGELNYDRLSGTFTLKLYRKGEAPASAFSADALEKSLALNDSPTALAGDANLLYDLGIGSRKPAPDKAVILSSAAVLPCSVGSALDGLRFAALEQHTEDLASAQTSSSDGERTGATVVGRISLKDDQGQLRAIRLRAGRGATYDWVVGQLCPLDTLSVPKLAVDSVAYSYEKERASSQHPVKAGQ